MAAQGFLLLASYLLVLLVLARPLGMCLARMVNDIPLPAWPGSSASCGAWPGSAPKRWAGCSICWRSCCLTPSAAWRCLPC
ncbi:Potassium-transporting ATPase A chain (TC 3.A.3.7.1) [Klebsiella pneumoniae ISC21]|nr:Potassium-transporting ATPase A chain (TC 3.A.3.7.1) [Klebsiella pneumoniae ISC21]